jgi:peroxiredoxin Q/BCP
MPQLKVGDAAPNVLLPDDQGRSIQLAELARDQSVVLFFYPKDDTPICTREACAFRDAYQDFVQAGAVVVGISADSADSHRDFAARRGLPFRLVSDAQGELAAAFGVAKTLGLMPGRMTFVIDRDLTVRMAFRAAFSASGHVREALKCVEDLQRERGKKGV